MKRCDVCRELKDEEEFAWRWKNLGIRGGTCRDCKKGYNKEYFQGPAKERHLQQVKERKQAAREYAREYVLKPLVESSNLSALTIHLHPGGFFIGRNILSISLLLYPNTRAIIAIGSGVVW